MSDRDREPGSDEQAAGHRDRDWGRTDGLHKTPMYEAQNADRYQRQHLIREINGANGRHLLCYVSGRLAKIDRDDALGFVEILHNVPNATDVDLILHTSGGDVDAAEKVSVMLESAVRGRQFRVIVPDYAKSAGTLIALGADTLLMSDTSELGTVDPQIWSNDGQGHDLCHSVLAYLDAYQSHARTLKENPDDTVSRIMIGKLDPTTVRHFEAIRDRTRNFAESQLKRKGRNFSKITAELMDISRWPSHGQMIGWQDLRELGLPVEFLSPKSKEWRAYWQLYCLLRLATKERETIFESADASFTLPK